jgi:hypothetical protein
MTSRLFGIVDCARDKRLFPLVKQTPNYACLFSGPIPEPLDATSPYLVELTDDTPLKETWRAEGWGQNWGLLVRSPLSVKELSRHLRKFLIAQLPNGNMVLFRFYDPRVWQSYWPTCSEEEKSKWLNGVDEFIAEPVETG